VTIPVSLSLVHYHPEPVDDCPCFEDAIAILAVILGSFLGHWVDIKFGMCSPAAHRRSIWTDGWLVGLVVAALRIVFGQA
jgi:hypothetical protein